MTPLQRFVQYVIIANAVLNVFSFINVKPDLARLFNFDQAPVALPAQVQVKQP